MGTSFSGEYRASRCSFRLSLTLTWLRRTTLPRKISPTMIDTIDLVALLHWMICLKDLGDAHL